MQSDLRKIGIVLHNYITTNGGLPTGSVAAVETAITTLLNNSEMKGKVTTGAYNITQAATSSDSNSRNLLICLSGGSTSPKFGIGALSKSGSVFFYTSTDGLKKDTTPWVGTQTDECPKLGINLTDANYGRSFSFDTATGGWKAWTQ